MRHKAIKKQAFNRKQNNSFFLSFFLFAFTFLLYSNTINNGYNLDDELVTNNHALTSKGFKAIPEILSSPYYSDMGTSYEYRPMVLISFAIEHQLFGENPTTSHLINVLLYSISVLLLFIFLKKLFASYNVYLVFVVVLIFAVHPLHTEVVASIKSRDELLAFLFGILSWNMALAYVNKNRMYLFVLTFLMFALGMLSKISIIPLAFIVPLSLLFFSNASQRHMFFLSLGFSILVALFAPFFNFSHKVLFGFLVFVAPFITGLLFIRKDKIEEVWSLLKDEFKNSSEVITGIKTFSVQALFFFIFLSVFLCGVGVFYNFRVLIFIALIGLLALYYIGDNKNKAYFFSTFIFLVSLVSVNYKQSHILAFCLVLILFMFFLVEKKFRLYLIFSLLFLLVPWIMWAGFESVFWLVFLSFIIWGVSIKKFRPYAFILIGVFLISSPLVSYMRHTSLLYSGHLFSVLALSITLFIYFKLKNYKLAALFLWVLIPIALAVKLSTITGSYSVVVERYFNPATSISIGADLLPASGRKLDKVEMPLDIDAPLKLKAGTALYVTAAYLKKLVFPLNMGFYYGYKQIEPQNLFHLQSLLSLLIHVVLVVLAFKLYKREKLFTFAVFFYLASISIFSNLVMPMPGLFADRFAYIPSLGFSILITIILFVLFKVSYTNANIYVKKHSILVFIIISVTILFSVRTYSRNFHWKNHLTLFRNDIAYLDNSAHAHHLLATHLVINAKKEKDKNLALKMINEAKLHYLKALDIYPDFFNAVFYLGGVHYDLAKDFDKTQNYDSALVYFDKAIYLRPDYYKPYMQNALIHHKNDSLEKAIVLYEKTLLLKPELEEAYKNLIALYFDKKDFENALMLSKKFDKDPVSRKELLIGFSKYYYSKQLYDSAALCYKEILLLNPNDINALKALVEVNLYLNNMDEVEYYKRKIDAL